MNMIHSKKLVTAILTVTVVSCVQNDRPTIETIELQNIVPEEVMLSDLTSGMETVRLETRDDCLIGQAGIIRIDSTHIYISDAVTRSILIFNRHDGKFTGKLNKSGRGPGEYLEITDFCIDPSAHTIEVLDRGGRQLLIYDMSDLSFIKAVSLPISASELIKKDGMYYLGTHGVGNYIDGERTNSGVITYKHETREFKALFDYVRPESENRVFWIKGLTESPDGQIYFSQIWDNTLYRIEENAAIPVLKVDGGRKEIPDRIKEGSYEQQEAFLNTSTHGYMFYRLAYRNGDKTVISFTDGSNPYKYLHYIQAGDKEKLVKDIIIDYIDGRPRMNLMNMVIQKDDIIVLWTPYTKHDEKTEAFLNSLGMSSEDNPAISIFKIKP